jgi:hypothetical protein
MLINILLLQHFMKWSSNISFGLGISSGLLLGGGLFRIYGVLVPLPDQKLSERLGLNIIMNIGKKIHIQTVSKINRILSILYFIIGVFSLRMMLAVDMLSNDFSLQRSLFFQMYRCGVVSLLIFLIASVSLGISFMKHNWLQFTTLLICAFAIGANTLVFYLALSDLADAFHAPTLDIFQYLRTYY